MDVSVIVVNWNTRDLLIECLESLIPEIKPFKAEIIVVDNASTDGSPAAIEKLFPQIKLIRNTTNLGFAKANNSGLDISTGKYICLINSDVKLLRDCIENMYKYMEDHQSIGILGPKILNPDFTIQPTCKEYPSLWNNFCSAVFFHKLFPSSKLFSGELVHYFKYDSPRKCDIIVGTFWMVRKKALDTVGCLDENFFFYGEDVDWCKRFWSAGWEVVFFPGASAVHHSAASSAAAPIKYYIEQRRAKITYWEKHNGIISVLGIKLIVLLYQVTRIMSGSLLYIMLPSKRSSLSHKIKKSFECMLWMLNISNKYN